MKLQMQQEKVREIDAIVHRARELIFHFGTQEGRKMGYGAMQGIPMVASSPIRHDSPLNLHGLEVTQYQPPWVVKNSFFRMKNSISRFMPLYTEGSE